MKLIFTENDLKLKYPFSISRHTYYSQPNIVVELQYEGFSGYGEATINPYYNITIENLKSSFLSIGSQLENYIFTTPDELWEHLSDHLETNSFAIAAVNNASWDLYGKMKNIPVGNLIELTKQAPPFTSYTLGIDEKEKMSEKMQQLPWPIYKVKLGTENDMDLIRFLKTQTNSLFRVDANCAWNVKKTLENANTLKDLGIEFIEQPLPKLDPDQMKCFSGSTLPLIADESCCIESDVEKCIGNFHGINIKLLKCGGLTPAIRMIKKARSSGLKVMVGCMTESSIGISAAAQLLSFVDFADLDGPLLLAQDLAEGLIYEKGNLLISGNPGLGIVPKKM